MSTHQHSGKAGANGRVIDTAAACRRGGLSVIPIRVDGSKAPAVPWKGYQTKAATERQLAAWFDRPDPYGFAVVYGRVSGNGELFDFDERADETFPAWCAAVESDCPGLLERLTVIDTPRGGYHVVYRVRGDVVPGNTKLAVDPSLPRDRQTLIETRGEGGYALAPGSPPACHETGRPYRHRSGPDLADLATITAAEREVLIRNARALSREPHPDPEPAAAAHAGLRPGDDFNARGPAFATLIEPHGWHAVREAKGVTYWARPDKDDRGWSATTGYCTSKSGVPLFAVFSSNADPFEGPRLGRPCSVYSPFGVYALLEHGGDYKAATKALAAQGYGDQAKKSGQGEATQADGSAARQPTDWPTPTPLGDDAEPPPLPGGALPRGVGGGVGAEADATQTPPDLGAMLSLTTAGAAVAGKFRVLVRPGWSEGVNLFTVVALPPGDRKTAVFADVLAPVQAFEREEQERMRPVIAEAASQHRILENRLKAVEQRAAKTDDAAEVAKLQAEAKELARELSAHRVPEPPRCFCDDATPEKLGKLLSDYGGRMLQASDEGTAFEIAKGRYSESANFDVYLKGHAGSPYRVGRISREDDTVDRPALSAALAVQPDVLQGLHDQASMKGRGFLARWLYAVPRSRVGRRAVAPPPVPRGVAEKYAQAMTALWRTEGGTDENGQPVPLWLRFAEDADRAMRDFESWLEPQLAEGGDLAHLAGWANKLAGAIARIAGVLHAAEAAGSGTAEPWRDRISRHAVEAAIRLGRDYLLPHALAAFCVMDANPITGLAARVLRWLAQSSECSEHSENAPLSVSRRDIHQAHRRAFKTADELDPVLKVLVSYGWLTPTGDGKAGRGHAAPVYLVHPAVRAITQKDHPRSHCTHCTHSEQVPERQESAACSAAEPPMDADDLQEGEI